MDTQDMGEEPISIKPSQSWTFFNSHIMLQGRYNVNGKVCDDAPAELQDRLVKALRRLQIASIKEANDYLEKTFMNEYNALFASREAMSNVHRSLNEYDVDLIFSFPFDRQVRSDYTLLFQNQFLQLLTGKAPLPKPRQTATIRRYLDHSLHVFYNDQELHFENFQKKKIANTKNSHDKKLNLYRKKNPTLIDFAFH